MRRWFCLLPVRSSCLHNMQMWLLQKKAKLRADLQLERYESHSEQEGEDSAVACATVHVLQSPLRQTSTVTVAPFSLHSDEEPAGDSDARCAGYTCWLAQCGCVAAQTGRPVPPLMSNCACSPLGQRMLQHSHQTNAVGAASHLQCFMLCTPA